MVAVVARPWVTHPRPVFLNDGVYAVANGGWVGLIRYRRRGQLKQWRSADPSQEACRERHEAHIRLAEWIGCEIISTRFGRGVIINGNIQWGG